MRGGFELGRRAGSACPQVWDSGKEVFTRASASEFTEIEIAKALLFIYSNPVWLDSIVYAALVPCT